MNIDYESLSEPVSAAEIDDFKKQCALDSGNSNETATKQLAGRVILVIIVILSIVIILSYRVFGIFFVFSGILIVYMNFRYVKKMRIVDTKLSRFAKENGLIFKVKTEDPNYDGMIFNIGNDRSSYSQLQSAKTGLYEIANYSYATGSGKDRSVFNFGYIMIKLDRNLPNIVLDSTKNNDKSLFGIAGSNLPVSFRNNQRLSLEGDFDKYFTLYVPSGCAEDALYIFSPDLMSVLIDELTGYDAEIIGDKLFIYSNSKFDLSNPVILQKLFKIINTVGLKVIQDTEHYTDSDNTGLATDAETSASALRLKRKMSFNNWIVVVVFAIMFIVSFVSIAFHQ
jgi:hypothetical protein